VIDRSGSMTATPEGFDDDKWTTMVDSLNTALDGISGQMSVGLQFFPDASVEEENGCGVPTCSGVVVQVSGGHANPVYFVSDRQGLWRFPPSAGAAPGQWEQLVPRGAAQRADKFFVSPYDPAVLIVADGLAGTVWRWNAGSSAFVADAALLGAITEPRGSSDLAAGVSSYPVGAGGDWGVLRDLSFVRGMLEVQQNAKIVRSLIELAHNLELEVVAEGVESQAILQALKHLGCDYAQGYEVGKATPIRELLARLEKQGS
jgi:hypothetical protein